MLALSRRPKETLILRHKNADGTYFETHILIHKVEGKQVRIIVDAYKFGTDVERICHDARLRDLRTIADRYDADMGSTALYDAVCRGIDELGQFFASLPEHKRPEDVIFVIATDGAENSSKKFSIEDVQRRIREQTNKYSWKFIFLASGIDAKATAVDLGFDQSAPSFDRYVRQAPSHAEFSDNLARVMDICMKDVRADRFERRKRPDENNK